MLVASTNRRPRIPNYFARLLSATAEVTNRSSPTRDKIIATVNSFYPRRIAMLAPYSHGPVSVCLSVCESQVEVILKRLNTGPHEQNHTIAQGL